MNWKYKALLHLVLSRLPLRERVHYCFQRFVTRNLPIPGTTFDCRSINSSGPIVSLTWPFATRLSSFVSRMRAYNNITSDAADSDKSPCALRFPPVQKGGLRGDLDASGYPLRRVSFLRQLLHLRLSPDSLSKSSLAAGRFLKLSGLLPRFGLIGFQEQAARLFG